ncbi:glycosyltransferase family 2 protein [Lysobacter tyrosinilyticus]
MPTASALPIVILPVGVDDESLDACLAALEAHTPPGTRIWLADDAQAGPRGHAIIERWIASTALQAHYTRRQRSVGEVAHLDEVLVACGDADVAVLASDAMPLPGWLTRLSTCLQADGAIASATPWSNAGETVSFPRIGEINDAPADTERLARAAAAMPGRAAELPTALTHAVLLRGSARQRAGGLDTASYGSWYAALIDLSLRFAGLGWRNVLCETAFVARRAEGMPGDGDLDAIAARWPTWHARVAHFLMDDPLRATREQLELLLATIGPPDVQGDLFA